MHRAQPSPERHPRMRCQPVWFDGRIEILVEHQRFLPVVSNNHDRKCPCSAVHFKKNWQKKPTRKDTGVPLASAYLLIGLLAMQIAFYLVIRKKQFCCCRNTCLRAKSMPWKIVVNGPVNRMLTVSISSRQRKTNRRFFHWL